MKKTVLILLFLFIIFLVVGCEGNTTTDNPPDTTTEATTEESTIEEKIIVLTPELESTEESTTEKLSVINDNPFYFTFKDEEQEFILYYKATVDGIYRFDFGTDDSTCDYQVELYGEKNDRIFCSYYSSNGKTCTLTKGKTYKFVITQYSGLPTGYITIGIPNEEMKVENNEINGQLTYIDQENTYRFHTNLEGVYRFDFITNDATCDYKVMLINEIKSDVFKTYYSCSTNGKAVRLRADTDYKIFVTQDYGFPEYKIEIHEPSEIESVNGTFSGEISFIGQENIYEFTPTESGEYEVSLYFYDKQCYCNLTLINDINAKLLSSVSSERVRTVSFEKGKKYKFIVEYGNGFLTYDVNIEKVIEEET